MQRDTRHHRHHKADRQRGAAPMRGGKTADRHHGGEMIEADHRMAEPGQDAFAEGRRHAAAHHVMREGRRAPSASRIRLEAKRANGRFMRVSPGPQA